MIFSENRYPLFGIMLLSGMTNVIPLSFYCWARIFYGEGDEKLGGVACRSLPL